MTKFCMETSSWLRFPNPLLPMPQGVPAQPTSPQPPAGKCHQPCWSSLPYYLTRQAVFGQANTCHREFILSGYCICSLCHYITTFLTHRIGARGKNVLGSDFLDGPHSRNSGETKSQAESECLYTRDSVLVFTKTTKKKKKKKNLGRKRAL